MFKTIVFLLILFSVGIIGIAINANEYLSEENFLPCPNPKDFHCSTGSVCIKSELECDGKKDCPDGSDEFEAECDFKLCKPPKFYTCKDNETCIVQNFRCDGHNDCPSNDDEDNCSDYVPHHEIIECNANEFTCMRDNMCIPMEFVCDGIHHCVDSSDENMGCLNIKKSCKGFLCKNNHCLNDKTWVCDGTDDCGDGSDETNCMSDCTSGNKKFLCSDSVTCIAIGNVCNNQKDCSDGSDEGGICNKFHNNTACELNYCPNNAECFIWPTGPVCVCPPGFSYNPQKKACEDIDECQTYGICSQGCVNSPGSYKCTCEKRFRLKGDKKTCESISHTEPVLLYAGKTSINMVYLRSNHQSVVTEKVRQVIGVSYDGHFVYWTNVALNSESIVKSREDGSKLETLLTTGLSLPEDIAVDWITGNLYFSDAMYMHIAVCSNDGKHCTSLITEKVERPRSLALYPQEGRMYWSEWGNEPMIAVANMDGSFAAPFIRDNIHWPSGVTLDWPNNRLYWVDAKVKKIESCNLDGTGRRTVIDQVLKHPYGLAVFENNIYWSDWSAMSIETCNKFSCKDKKVVVKDRKVYDIHIYHNSIQPITKNPCKNNKCSHLCMLASNSTFTCGCPTGMALEVDQLSCSSTIKKESIYIGLRNYLIMMEHETFGRHQIEKAKVVPMYIHKMTFNLLNGHVFIADNIARIIYDYDLVEEKAIELISTNLGVVTSMSFGSYRATASVGSTKQIVIKNVILDHLSNNLYWADSEHGTVEIYSMNTKHRAIVHHYFPAKPIGIAVIPENGHMFVASRTYFGHTHIDIQSLHGGGDHHHIIESQLGDQLIEFAIDRQAKEVYFCDSEMHQISWTDYTGGSLFLFQAVPAEPISIAVLSDDVFWTSNKSHDIFWTPKHSPDTTKQLVLPHHDFVTNDDRPVLVGVMPTVVSSHPCTIDNGGCSHICATYDSKQHVCLCPPGMVFSDYRNSTCMEAIDCEFRCGSGECITASRQCNNFKDCADESDERDCASHENTEEKCYRDEFKCLDGKQCVAIELRCDKINDCNDKSDERDCIGYNATTKCHENHFRCTDGLCIDLTAVCDGTNDCEDGLDELKCHDKKAMKNVCKSNMFTCANGQCVPAKWVCDEFPDCRDGSDEHHCPEKVCPEGFLQCKHGRCVHLDLVCDGFNNCGDYTDEMNCTNVPAPATCSKFDSNNEPLQFQCVSDKTICLNITARCNGTAECPRGEDEADCTGCRINEFECANKKCIRQEWRCDQQNDCGDRSDEIGCVNEAVVTNKTTNIGCGPGMFSCRDGNCIYMELVCNGHNDCPNKMDESKCL
ncbi:hypothetical protein HA402_013826 [Bradysia odoriphaga]|nr:hypothetical protein HA402_013826 [Bradysia odoriphaga]